MAVKGYPLGVRLEELHGGLGGKYSRRTLQRWLQSLARSQRIEVAGQGPVTVYKLPVKPTPPIPGHIGAIPSLVGAAQNISSGDMRSGEDQRTRISNEVLSQELLALETHPELRDQLLNVLFRGATPFDPSFYAALERLHLQCDFGDSANRITSLLWERALHNFANDEKDTREDKIEKVMLSLSALGHSFWILLTCLPQVMKTQKMSGRRFVNWCEAMLKRIGDDLGGQGFYESVVTFCESWPANALDALKVYQVEPKNAGLVAAMLGTLRRQQMPDALRIHLEAEEARFRENGNQLLRGVYFQSWTQDARAEKLSEAVWDGLVICARQKGPDDTDLLFRIGCTMVNIPQVTRSTKHHILHWLLSEASERSSELAKFCVAQLASFQRSSPLNPSPWKDEISKLILQILPIKKESKGTWDSLEFYLTSLIPNDTATFELLCKAIAKKNGGAWLSLLKAHPGMPSLLGQMKAAKQSELITDLCLSLDRSQRQIGLFLFDELHIEQLEVTRLTASKADICWLLLHEVEGSTIDGGGAARILVSLLGQTSRMGERFNDALQQEIILQVKNYPGKCGETFAAYSAQYEFLKKAVELRDRYFTALAEAKKSSLWRMEVPGYRRAVAQHQRDFQNQVQQGAKKHSVFLNFVHEVQLLYGKAWSTFVGESLSAPSQLSSFGHSVEFPRLELIDPEQMQFRRLVARSEINLIESRNQTPSEKSLIEARSES